MGHQFVEFKLWSSCEPYLCEIGDEQDDLDEGEV